jgi:hypothetical protein
MNFTVNLRSKILFFLQRAIGNPFVWVDEQLFAHPGCKIFCNNGKNKIKMNHLKIVITMYLFIFSSTIFFLNHTSRVGPSYLIGF